MLFWKRAALLLTALALTVSAFAGCGGRKQSDDKESSAAVEPTPEPDAVIEGESASLNGYSKGIDMRGYFEGVIALDYVTLPDYKSIKVPSEVGDISMDEVKAEMNSWLEERSGPKQVTDRAVKDGDTVNIDYVGSIDGVEFEGGSTKGNGTDVTIGVTSYIDDFLEQLIGHMPGETINVEVTFPVPYPSNNDLAGKDAVFVTRINYISEEVKPELDNEFVKENYFETRGWKTVKDMRSGIKKIMRDKAVSDYVWNEIMEQVEVSDIPAQILDYNIRVMESYYTSLSEQYGIELDELLENMLGVSGMDQLVEQNMETLEENAKKSLVLQALSEDMGFRLTEELLNDYLGKLLGPGSHADVVAYYGRPYLCLIARESLVMDELAKDR